MQLGKIGYYADYVVYPIVIVALSAAALAGTTEWAALRWGGAVLAGLAAWTLLEYLLHRVALHRIACLVPLHDLHHRMPLAYVGTPTWLSVGLLAGGLLLPSWYFGGYILAAGLTAGVMAGYLWYGLVHHLIHHRRGRRLPQSLLGLRAWHLRHHYSPKSGNFGVTTRFWDRMLGTAIGR